MHTAANGGNIGPICYSFKRRIGEDRRGFFLQVVEWVYGGERYDGRNETNSGCLWLQ